MKGCRTNSVDNILCQMFDSHVHVGTVFGAPGCRRRRFDVDQVARWLTDLGLAGYAVSSTTTSFDPDGSVDEMRQIVDLLQDRVIPLLWLTPAMLSGRRLGSYLSALNWRGIKIHPLADRWDLEAPATMRLFRLAAERDLPVLMHTGWTTESNAGLARAACHQFPAVRLVLGHGRPIEETLSMLGDFENVRVDTAYMSIEDIRKIVVAGMADRILYGSDFPLDACYYSRMSIKSKYKHRVADLVRSFGVDNVLAWSTSNFRAVFPSCRTARVRPEGEANQLLNRSGEG